MKLTNQQRTAMKEAERKGERRVFISLTPAQRREAQKIAAAEDASIRRELAARKRTKGSAAAETIGDALKAAIANSGRTHYRLAKDAGISPDAIDRFVSGERTLTLETVNKLGAALGLTLSSVQSGAKK